MREEDVIAFARRDWKAIEESKRQRWADQKAQLQPADALQIGDMLRHHAKALHPDWPTQEDRQRDLAMHVRVSESLRRVRRTDSR